MIVHNISGSLTEESKFKMFYIPYLGNMTKPGGTFDSKTSSSYIIAIISRSLLNMLVK